MPANNKYLKKYRLLKRADFVSLSQSKLKLYLSCILVIWKHNDENHSRLGITATKKIGNSVVRVGFKRIIREYFRCHKNLLPPVDLNIIALRNASSNNREVICYELEQAFSHIVNLYACKHIDSSNKSI